LEIIGVSTGERVVEVAPASLLKWLPLPFFSRFGAKGSSRGSYGGMNRRMTWLGSPELLKPGAKIRVGMHGPLKEEPLKFALDLPDLVEPR